MNIYKMKSKEVHKLHNEFNKTDFGRKVKIFSMLPAVSLIFTIIFALANDGNTICTCFILLNLALLGITQLQYGNMLKEYVQSKKDK